MTEATTTTLREALEALASAIEQSSDPELAERGRALARMIRKWAATTTKVKR